MASPQTQLEWGDKYPYDASDEWWNMEKAPPPLAIDWAQRAARGVISDLKDRRGIKRGFENIDEDIRKEIVESLAAIIRLAEIQRSVEVRHG